MTRTAVASDLTLEVPDDKAIKLQNFTRDYLKTCITMPLRLQRFGSSADKTRRGLLITAGLDPIVVWKQK